MKTDNAKLIAGLFIGAAVGAALACFFTSDKRDDMLAEIGSTVDKAKKKLTKIINQGMEELDTAVDKVNTLAHTAISRAKATTGDPIGKEEEEAN